MNRASAIVFSAIFAVIAPGTVGILLPWYITRWNFHEPFFHLYFLRWLGGLLIILALPILLNAFGRFAIEGFGTPAPIMPTRHLIVTGPYRYVRNPMYVSVLALIIGQALLFGSISLLIYGAMVWSLFHLFVLFYEEPKLRKTYGEEFESFCRNVPRWVPRLNPWRAS
jgi:protein-S-isoprenylcysteine O-methyltransferase Ste14